MNSEWKLHCCILVIRLHCTLSFLFFFGSVSHNVLIGKLGKCELDYWRSRLRAGWTASMSKKWVSWVRQQAKTDAQETPSEYEEGLSDQVQEQIAQWGSSISLTRDTQKLSGCNSVPCVVRWPCCSREVGPDDSFTVLLVLLIVGFSVSVILWFEIFSVLLHCPFSSSSDKYENTLDF